MTIKEVLEKIDIEMEQLKMKNKNLQMALAFLKPVFTHFDLENHKQLIEDNAKLKKENEQLNDTIDYLKTERRISAKCNHYMLEQRDRLEVENQQLKAKLQKYESNEPQYCDVSGVKLDKKVKCPMCEGRPELGQCRVCYGAGTVWDRQ